MDPPQVHLSRTLGFGHGRPCDVPEPFAGGSPVTAFRTEVERVGALAHRKQIHAVAADTQRAADALGECLDVLEGARAGVGERLGRPAQLVEAERLRVAAFKTAGPTQPLRVQRAQTVDVVGAVAALEAAGAGRAASHDARSAHLRRSTPGGVPLAMS